MSEVCPELLIIGHESIFSIANHAESSQSSVGVYIIHFVLIYFNKLTIIKVLHLCRSYVNFGQTVMLANNCMYFLTKV